LAFFN